MRITAGQDRGRLVTCPDGGDVRPTAAKVRQALFNILAARLPDCAFLDVCAGSGLMGLEALSRGAKTLIAIEEKRQLVKMFEDNLRNFGYQAQIISGDAGKVLPRLDPERFDIIFADPPYRSQLPLKVLHAVARAKLLKLGGILVIEHGTQYPLPEHIPEDLSGQDKEGAGTLVRIDMRKYGQTALSFYQR